MAAVKVHLYRYRHPDGTAKDWAVPVAVASQGLTVYYGRTGSALRQADTPAGRCQDGLPVREGELRVREKLGKGYRSLGEFWLADNRRDLTPAGPSAGAPPSPTAAADTARAGAGLRTPIALGLLRGVEISGGVLSLESEERILEIGQDLEAGQVLIPCHGTEDLAESRTICRTKAIPMTTVFRLEKRRLSKGIRHSTEYP